MILLVVQATDREPEELVVAQPERGAHGFASVPRPLGTGSCPGRSESRPGGQREQLRDRSNSCSVVEFVVVTVASASVRRNTTSRARPPNCSLRIDDTMVGTPASRPEIRPSTFA